MIRKRIFVHGQVQGVGFRPFVYRQAIFFSLTGFVLNTSQGVKIEIQGKEDNIGGFSRTLRDDLPPLARIVRLEEEELEPETGEREFIISESSSQKGHEVLISPDVCTCGDCLRELFDPRNRRYLYPFLNCTNCGPRYTITRSVPYDRSRTSMTCFPLCTKCRAEYENPLDRRFHAQPNACPDCGPEVWLVDSEGRNLARRTEAILGAVGCLLQGGIVALKGLGGFHLACDAGNEKAVGNLRRRKNRPDKALAVMVENEEDAKYFAEINEEEKNLLEGIQRPIVVLHSKEENGISPEVSPDTNRIGIMLPYTPLHFVLFHLLKREKKEQKTPPVLVMTSGNSSSEPISLGNREALSRLKAIADRFLLHNRDILVRCDDSVAFSVGGRGGFYRRARGYTPSPIFLARSGETVLGTGPELKNTLCLTKGDQAFVSQHVGDLKNLQSYDFFLEMCAHLQSVLQVQPKAIVRDLHPDYLSSRYAEEQDKYPVYTLQHHYAHIYSVLAENRFQGACLGLALDGTGLGEDGTIWGGELLYVNTKTLEQSRIGSFRPVPMPGGEMAVQEPWRMARAYQYQIWGERGLRDLQSKSEEELLLQILEKGINCPLTSSCGRLFDAVSGLLGLVHCIAYEGQAAICLESVRDKTGKTAYSAPFKWEGDFLYFGNQELFTAAAEDFCRGGRVQDVSRGFVLGLIEGLADWAAEASRVNGVENVALSGGVMQNLTLFQLLPKALQKRGLSPLVHSLLPPNDGCISLGQSVYGQRLLEMGKINF